MRSADLRQVFRNVLSVSLLGPLVAAGAAACSGQTIDMGNGDGGTTADGGGGTSDGGTTDGGAACAPPNRSKWNKPGCGRPADLCVSPNTPEPACYSVVCGCSGKFISGCSAFDEAYVIVPIEGPGNFPQVGSPCDPSGVRDAGPDGCVSPPQPVADGGAGCTPWNVPMPCSYPADGSVPTMEQCKSFCGGYAYLCAPLPEDASVLRCDPGCAIGRRPEGFGRASASSARTGDVESIVGLYFAAMTELEAASVFSFERLERELAAHGAPQSLQKRARRAACDERRHARVAGALAHRFGGQARTVDAAPTHVRSLEDIAIENAVEGCVRETFGALVATLQAERAGDARVKAAMRRIAVDETAHASLAWAVAQWIDGQLDDETRARVAAAKARAIAELQAEVRVEQPAPLRVVAGLPTAREADRMIESMAAELWAA